MTKRGDIVFEQAKRSQLQHQSQQNRKAGSRGGRRCPTDGSPMKPTGKMNVFECILCGLLGRPK
jgi:hypothetical protein